MTPHPGYNSALLLLLLPLLLYVVFFSFILWAIWKVLKFLQGIDASLSDISRSLRMRPDEKIGEGGSSGD
jgi:hypothetical protein